MLNTIQCPHCSAVIAEPLPGNQLCASCNGQYVGVGPQSGPQSLFLSLKWVDIVGYGGAAGGGKTFAELLDPLSDIDNPNSKAIFFRRESVQITNPGGLWDTSMELYPLLGGKPTKVNNKHAWRFPSGAKIVFDHLNNENDKFGHQGSQIPLIYFDELTHFTETQFWYMGSRNRSAHGVKKRIRPSFNPDATSWVKNMFAPWVDSKYADPAGSGEVRWLVRHDDEYRYYRTKREAMDIAREVFKLNDEQLEHAVKSVSFVRARLSDNKILNKNDPGYLASLLALSKVEQQRLLNGDWDVLEDSFFDWLPKTSAGTPWHVVPTGPLPKHWRYEIGLDWGFNDPCAMHLLGVAPDGRITVCREKYQRKRGTKDLGLDMVKMIAYNGLANTDIDLETILKCSDDELQEAIVAGELDCSNIPIKAGHDVFNRRLNSKGEYDEPISSIWTEESINLNVISCGRDPVNRADAWRRYLTNWGPDDGWPDGRPGIQVMECCPSIIRTLPLLKSDKSNPEVVDTTMDDHCLVGSTLIDTTNGQILIKDLVGTTGMVYSYDAMPHEYTNVRLTKHKVPVFDVTFSDGRCITGTGNHPFLTQRGWMRIDELGINDVVVDRSAQGYSYASKHNQQHNSGVQRTPLLSLLSTNGNRCILCNAPESDSMAQVGGSKGIPPRSGKVSTSRQGSCQNDMRHLRQGLRDLAPEEIAFLRKELQSESLYATQACIVESVTPSGQADVYNMQVDAVHSFSVQGGLIVHNSYDAVGHMLTSRPERPDPETKEVPDTTGRKWKRKKHIKRSGDIYNQNDAGW